MDDILNYLNKVNQIKEDYIGLEDNWNDYEDAELPYDVNDIQVAQKMITVFQVEYWISNNLLDLQPEYQRNLVWDAQRKSLLKNLYYFVFLYLLFIWMRRKMEKRVL